MTIEKKKNRCIPSLAFGKILKQAACYPSILSLCKELAATKKDLKASLRSLKEKAA